MSKLLIDAQVFHTPAFHRGMGKYSLELLTQLVKANRKSRQWDTIEAVVSSHLDLTDEAIEALSASVGPDNITKLNLRRDLIHDAKHVSIDNRKILDEYITSIVEDNKETIDFLILSPMQGGITSVFPSSAQVRKSVIFYDLIPFMFHEVYFRNPIAKLENLTKLGELLKADIFLAISKTVANDLAIYLGVDAERVCNIDGGPINHSEQSEPIDIPKPFVLMPTGNELRKNNRLGILGFNEFNKSNNDRYSLVITSFFEPDQVTELSGLAANVVFTGNISGAQLDYLYEECEAMLFPSEYEGLGLPVLEAAQKGKPVACSDISVFREMSKTAFSYFDPTFGTSIANALSAAVNMKPNKKEYERVLNKYSWERTASAAMSALKRPVPATIGSEKKPQILIFGTNPECGKPSGRTLQRAHAELSRYINPKYFLDGRPQKQQAPRVNMLGFVSEAALIAEDVALNVDEFDALVYVISNDEYSAKTIFTALAKPGIVILTDLYLDKAWQALLQNGLIDERRLELEQTIQAKFATDESRFLGSLLANQKAIAVFSVEAKTVAAKIIKAMGRHVPVEILAYPISQVVYRDTLPNKDGSIIMIGESGDPAVHEPFLRVKTQGHRKILAHEQDLQTTKGPEDIENVGVGSDRDFENLLSRASFTYGSDESSILNALEGVRYGTLPLFIEGAKTTLPLTALAEVFKGIDYLNNRLAEFGTSSVTYSQASDKLVKNSAKTGSYKQYAEDLSRIIIKVIQDAE